MSCGDGCGCPQCEGRVASDDPSVHALQWGILAGQRTGVSDFWAGATARTFFRQAIAGISGADDVRAWVDQHAHAGADDSSITDTRYSWPPGFGPPEPDGPLPWLEPDPPPPPPPPPRRKKAKGWLSRGTWSYERFQRPMDHVVFGRLMTAYPAVSWLVAAPFPGGRGQGLWQGGPLSWERSLRVHSFTASMFGMSWTDWSSTTLRRACCLRKVVANASLAPYPAPRTWFPDQDLGEFLVETGYHAWIEFAHIKDDRARGPRCDCACCQYRQFVSVRVKTTHKDGSTFAHDFGAELKKPYVIEDYTDRPPSGFWFSHLIEEWQPVVVKMNHWVGMRNGKAVYEPRHFYEDITVYDPSHPAAWPDRASLNYGMVSARVYFGKFVHTPVEVLRAMVSAFGREPFDDPDAPGASNLRSECSNWFKDHPRVAVMQDSVTDYEIIFIWIVHAAQPDCLCGGVVALWGPNELPKGKPNPTQYACGGRMFSCRIAVRLDYTGPEPKVTTTGRAFDKTSCHYRLDERSPQLW